MKACGVLSLLKHQKTEIRRKLEKGKNHWRLEKRRKIEKKGKLTVAAPANTCPCSCCWIHDVHIFLKKSVKWKMRILVYLKGSWTAPWEKNLNYRYNFENSALLTFLIRRIFQWREVRLLVCKVVFKISFGY